MLKSGRKQMFRIFRRIVKVVFMVAFAGLVIYEVAASDPVEYYRRAPYILFVAGAAAGLFGLVIWLFSEVDFRKHRRFVLWVWGGANVVATCVAAGVFVPIWRLLLTVSSLDVLVFLKAPYLLFCAGCLLLLFLVWVLILMRSWQGFA